MANSLPATTLERLGTKLREQVLEVAALQLALDIQSSRIACMQAERDLLEHGSQRP
jgi:hypothetical protein